MSKEEDGRRGFRVRGRVQGVGFRWWTRRTAQGLGVRGLVRNMPDGSVEVHAVGPADALARLEEALRRGPPAARVERIDAMAADPAADRPDFTIDA